MNTLIFTDGAARGNPGPGGWAAIVVEKPVALSNATEDDGRGTVLELGGRQAHATNNQMELQAAIQGLKHSPKDVVAVLHTDSSYVINGMTKWVAGWKRNGWQTKTRKDVLNRDLWEELAALAGARRVDWRYVGGHVGVIGNERCDYIATAFADEQPVSLYKGSLAAYGFPNIANISADMQKSATKKSSSSHSRAAAYSYVSMVGGDIQTHASWAECEKRVKGTRGARYKKAVSSEAQNKIIAEFKGI